MPSVIITGHRPNRIPGYFIDPPPEGWESDSYGWRMMYSILGKLRAGGIDRVVTGLALGIDTMATKVALRMNAQGTIPHMRTAGYSPFPTFTDRWGEMDRNYYRTLVDGLLDKHVMVQDAPRPNIKAAYLVRNRAMINHSDSKIVLAFIDYDYKRPSGALYTVKYAAAAGLAINVIDLTKGRDVVTIPGGPPLVKVLDATGLTVEAPKNEEDVIARWLSPECAAHYKNPYHFRGAVRAALENPAWDFPPPWDTIGWLTAARFVEYRFRLKESSDGE